MKYDIFISYSRKDSAIVKKFAEELGKAGYKCWMDVDGIETGDEFKRKIALAIKNSRIFLFFSSRESNSSEWTVKEVNYAVSKRCTIIPVKLDDSDYDDSIDFDLSGLDYIQCNGINAVLSAKNKLLRSLNNILAVEMKNAAEEPVEEECKGGNTYSSVHNHKETSAKTSGMINGHEFVDLGLPSGLKWATCNVGAATPEEYGDHYAWGEVKTKRVYDIDSYVYAQKRAVFFLEYLYGKPIRYSYNDIGLDIKGTQYDVARKKWGGSWRIPTIEEFQELIDNCVWEWKIKSGNEGYWLTSKKNGNGIFLPASGMRYDSSFDCANEEGKYWSATLFDEYDANFLFFDVEEYECTIGGRLYGHSVRPVSE